MPSSTELPRISTPRFGEAALIRAPIPYRTRPAVKQRLRPQMSVSLLAGIMRTAMISRNRVIAACTPVTVVSRSFVMSLIITFMFEPAKLQMNWASASGVRNLRRESADSADGEPALKPPPAFQRPRPSPSARRAALGVGLRPSSGPAPAAVGQQPVDDDDVRRQDRHGEDRIEPAAGVEVAQ